MSQSDRVLTPGEVADMFRVDAKTVTRWVAAGLFPKDAWFKTPGGHLRFRESYVKAMVGGGGSDSASVEAG